MSLIIAITLAIQMPVESCASCRSMWMSGDGLPAPAYDYFELRGRVDDGSAITATLWRDRDHSAIEVTVTIGGRRFGSSRLSSARFPDLDLSSTELEATPERAYITIRYGPGTDCYLNDDGRNRLKILFVHGRPPLVYETTIRNCDADTLELNE
jgi:hypothetical protein